MSTRGRPSPARLRPLVLPIRAEHLRLLALVLVLAIPLTAILTFQLLPSRYQLHEGEAAPTTIKSPDRVVYSSPLVTRQERELAAASVPEVTRREGEVASQQIGKAFEALKRISSVRDDPTLSPSRRQELLQQIVEVQLTENAVRLILRLDPEGWRQVMIETTRVLGEVLRGDITGERVPEEKARLGDRIMPTLSPEQATVVREIATSFVVANTTVDRAATEEARQRAREAVRPVRVTVERGESIVRDGEIVRATDLEKLEAVGLLNPTFQWQNLGGTFLLVLALCVLLGIYVYQFQPSLLTNNRRLLLLVTLMVSAVLAAKLVVPGREIYAYAFPLATAPMLIATLLDAPLAIVVSVVLSLLFGQVVAAQFDLVVLHIAAGWAGVLGVRRADRLNRFFLAGLGVAVATFVLFAGFALLTNDFGLSRLSMYALVFGLHGALASIGTVGSFSVLGSIFGVVTTMHLLELAHPNQPLLRRLLTEAPGSYHHSIIVANLAERAAEAVGADALLTRVGAYYHDVGKVLRPGFFVDNQMPGENVHDLLDPETSGQIVVAHVTDGLELARQHRLPAKIRDFIAEHHGTTMAGFFYHRACQQNGSVDPAPYRYPGPRPQSKETAIVMLADAVEAVARSSKDRSPEALGQLIDKVVGDRLTHGQLDECALTLRDLAAIKQAFQRVLQGVYHPRIEYPEPVKVGL